MDGDNRKAAGLCVGLDIGYGNIKMVSSLGGPPFQQLILPVGAAPETQAAKTMGGRTDVGDGALVLIQGEPWVAGVRPLDLQDFARPTHANYPKTKEYLALYYAALCKLGRDHVSVLVTGLPVSQFYEGKKNGAVQEIVDRLQGSHYINAQCSVTVDRVIVVPQPYGSYTDIIQQEPELGSETDRLALCADIGYFSTDYVLLRGQHVIDTASGSSTDATSRILEDAAKQISQANRGVAVSAARVESALRSGKDRMTLGAVEVDYMAFVHAAASTVVGRVISKIQSDLRGQTDMIDLVILTGGGGSLFERAFRRAFPESKVAISKEPVIANARGFMHMARSVLANAK